METTKEPYFRDLQFRGFIEGLTIKSKTSGEALCHYFGGIPYALPSVGPYRWRAPRPLPPCYRYGTRANPGRFNGHTGECPQLGREPGYEKQPPFEDEDCLQCNIWLPAGEVPKEGWPVYFYIHGGFLQFGTPNGRDYTAMLSDTNFRGILVMPAYRLNLFGFLASRELQQEADSHGEPMGNFGFWDQRLALEWTRNGINYFGGNPSNITIAGYSAGAHSVFHQLSYDIGQPTPKAIVKRAIMHSNSSGMQPKSLAESQDQFDELLTLLKIPLSLSASEKLSRLRSTPPKDLLAASDQMTIHEFRAVSDGSFVRKTLFQEVEDGSYARVMKERGIKLLIGECRDEHFVYGSWRPPKSNSAKALHTRLQADYPLQGVNAITKLYYPEWKVPDGVKDWYDAFGRIYADMQVHMLERGFINCLTRGGAGDLIYRYRVEWRAKETDRKVPKEWGVTHATDNSIWMWGEGVGLEPEEKKAAKRAFMDEYAKFVKGEELSWGTSSPRESRVMRPDGSVAVWKDVMWDRGLEVWETLKEVGLTETKEKARL